MQPDLDIRPNRYIWYGTNQLFHGLTLTFRENDAGVFAAPLMESIIDNLCIDCTEADRQRLTVLKQSLVWQMTMGGMKL